MVMGASLAMLGVMSICGGDFAGGMHVGDCLSSAVGDRRVISATGFQSELLRRHSMERAAKSPSMPENFKRLPFLRYTPSSAEFRPCTTSKSMTSEKGMTRRLTVGGKCPPTGHDNPLQPPVTGGFGAS